MTIAYHMSTTPEHYTPKWLVEIAHAVLGRAPDLDPASCVIANEVVGATRYYSMLERGEDGSVLPWWGPGVETVFVNAPSGKNNLPGRFWRQALEAERQGITVLWLGFNLNQLCSLQRRGPGPLHRLTCVLTDRVRFDSLGRPGASRSVWSEAKARSKEPAEVERWGGQQQAYDGILEELLAGPLTRVSGESPALHNYVTLLGKDAKMRERFRDLLALHGTVVHGDLPIGP